MSSLLKVFLRLDSFPLLSLSYINSKLETIFVNFYIKSGFVNVLLLFTIFIKLHHAGTVCARRRARLLVYFDRPVGWNQTVRLRLIKLIRLMCSNNNGYT